MRREQNRMTQPFREQSVFNNWDVVTKGWYLICKSSKIKKRKLKSFEICGQRIVLFRGEDGKVRCLDAFCSHMGADLGIAEEGTQTVDWLRR